MCRCDDACYMRCVSLFPSFLHLFPEPFTDTENRCQRHRVKCLAYLWQRDQTQLLDEMAKAGMESIIIKVAGAGLRLRHLGLNVAGDQMRNELQLLVSVFFFSIRTYCCYTNDYAVNRMTSLDCTRVEKVGSTRLSRSTVRSSRSASMCKFLPLVY
jgi:hypothetical protein